jgi:hypothetical protein
MTEIIVTSSGATEILVGLDARIAKLTDMDSLLESATDIVYDATEQWFESAGEGTWPELAESTVTSKATQGYSDPGKPLYAAGNLFQSVTSPNGPYSFRVHSSTSSISIGADWEEGGYQIPVVLSEGTDSAGPAHNVRIPARPIWPQHGSGAYSDMMSNIAKLMLQGI